MPGRGPARHDRRMTRPPRPTPAATRLAWATAAMLAAVAMFLVAGGPPVEAAPAPTISSLSPTTGPSTGGTTVSISGSGFVSGATVSIGGTPATGVSVVSATQITAVTPAGTPGAVSVTVQNADGQAVNLGGGFTYQYPAPTVTAVAPTSGTSAGGTAITITGTGFRTGATVNIGGLANATSVVLVSATSITAVTPAGLVGANAVTVTNTDAQTGTLAGGFTYTAAAAPTVTSLAPSSGTAAGGTVVTITGTGFVSGATVSIGGTAATSVTVVNATTITATTPARTTSGAVSVLVSNPDTQSGALSNGYTYTPLPAPTVTTAGVAATNVIVTGSTTATAVTPQRPAGAGTVTVTNPDGQSGSLLAAFTATANATPAVSSVTPNTGTTTGGTSITIAGSGFLPGATVVVGGAIATSVTVVSATAITAVTPAHSAGAVAVTVTNYDGLAGTTGTGFTYKANAAPTISSVSPAGGVLGGGTNVTITGTNFQPGATVRFGNNTSWDTTIAGTTGILAITPPAAAGVAPIVVTNPDGQSAVLASGFTYSAEPAPVITSVSPTEGPTTGGPLVTITGTDFVAGATVMFGLFTAQSPVINPTSISVTAPPNLAGTVPVIVRNPDGQVSVLASGFTYAGSGTPNVAPTPPLGGISFVLSGTDDLQALMAAQPFTVVAVFSFDAPTQIWQAYVVGAPQNSLTTIKRTDILVLRR